MKKLLLAIIVVMSSCATTRYMAADTVPSAIPGLAKFETISRISVIEKRNRLVVDDSISHSVRPVLDSIMLADIPLSLTRTGIPFADTAQMRRVEENLAIIARNAEGNKKSPIFIPHSLDSLITAHGERYALFVVHSGFTRTGGNYAGEIMKGIGLGILTSVATMGMMSVYTVPTKAASTIYVFIIDAEQDRVVFYDRSNMEGEPTKPKMLSKQVKNLFRDL